MSPHFLIVMGGSGSGKNHYIENHPTYRSYELIDADVIKDINMIKPALLDAFSRGLNVAHPTTGAGNIVSITNKLALAKENGYETTVVLIDTPLEKSLQNIAGRVGMGGHGVPDWKVEKTNVGARKNFETLRVNPLVDDAKIVGGNVSAEGLVRDYVRLMITG